MLDTHLIYQALTAFGIVAGTAILISAAIVIVAAVRHNRTAAHKTLAGTGASRHSVQEPALR